MIEMNIWALITAAFIPILTQKLWYSSLLFGNSLQEKLLDPSNEVRKINTVFMLLISFALSFFIAFLLQTITIHQFAAMGLTGGDVTEAKPSYHAFMQDYGLAFRSFGHGALHSFLAGIFLIFPILALEGRRDKKSWKSILIKSGYWIFTLMLMGGLICGWYALDRFQIFTLK